MNRDEVLGLLRRHKATLSQRFGVAELALFGSFARDRNTDDSDIDILVRFDGPATSKRFFRACSSILKTWQDARSIWLPTRRCEQS